MTPETRTALLFRDRLRSRIAEVLEEGAPPTSWRRAVSGVWEAVSAHTVRRPLVVPAGVHVIGIGGTVFGGAGKTPMAIALTRELAGRASGVAFVGHTYRAAPAAPRRVAPDDHPRDVGDDALSAARLLGGDAPVHVAPTRQRAVDHAAAEGARVLVVDGLLQATPAPVGDAILVVDARAPFGSGACPPLGDLRAPGSALVAAADHIAAITDADAPLDVPASLLAVAVPSRTTAARDASGRLVPLESLASSRLGLFLAIARPTRVQRALERAGIRPEVEVILPDHAVPNPRFRRTPPRVDAWLTTARCATKLPALLGGAPVLALEHRLDVAELVARLRCPQPWSVPRRVC